jgi:hypothetical protein
MPSDCGTAPCFACGKTTYEIGPRVCEECQSVLPKREKQVTVLRKAIFVLCMYRCPACPGTNGGHDDRCWLCNLMTYKPGDPAFEAAAAAILGT